MRFKKCRPGARRDDHAHVASKEEASDDGVRVSENISRLGTATNLWKLDQVCRDSTGGTMAVPSPQTLL